MFFYIIKNIKKLIKETIRNILVEQKKSLGVKTREKITFDSFLFNVLKTFFIEIMYARFICLQLISRLFPVFYQSLRYINYTPDDIYE